MKTGLKTLIGILVFGGSALLMGCESTMNSTGSLDETELASNSGLVLMPLATATTTVVNDGLNPLDISGLSATDFVTAGTGTASRAEEEILIEVPSGATIEAVYLYWARLDNDFDYPAQAPSTILVNGTEYTGVVAGGPIDNPNIYYPLETKAGITHKLNLTGAGLISTGMNTITVQDDPAESGYPLGASIIVFYSENDENGELLLFDGADYIWANSAGETIEQRMALSTARPVTFMFDAAGEERTADLTLLIGDVEPDDAPERPNSLKITIGDNPTQVIGPDPSPFQGFQGPEWDNYELSLTIPAGADQVTVEPVSGPGTNPASLLWSLAGLSITVPQQAGGQGCTPGYWRQPFHYDSWINYDPDQKFGSVFNVPASLNLVRPERGKAANVKLKDAIKLRGGGLNALIRHTVAALLNASNDDVSYDLSVNEVISKFNSALKSGNYNQLKDEFEQFNELGCPLN